LEGVLSKGWERSIGLIFTKGWACGVADVTVYVDVVFSDNSDVVVDSGGLDVGVDIDLGSDVVGHVSDLEVIGASRSNLQGERKDIVYVMVK